MNDWETLNKTTPWDIPENVIKVGTEKPPNNNIFTDDFQKQFPKLSELVKMARITIINTDNKKYFLFGWTKNNDESFGWICPEASNKQYMDFHPDHNYLLTEFGGIEGRWNEPDETWLANMNTVLTEDQCGEGPDGWYEYYVDRCIEEGFNPVIKAEDYVAFAFEANGNAFLYHRKTSNIILYASDCDYDFIEPIEGVPEWTLYYIPECNTLKDWIEIVSSQWLRFIKENK